VSSSERSLSSLRCSSHLSTPPPPPPRYEISYGSPGNNSSSSSEGEQDDKKKASPSPKKGSERGKVAVSDKSQEKDRRGSTGGVKKANSTDSKGANRRHTLKAKMKKVGNLASGADAFGRAGSARSSRIKRKKTSKYGWIAKDMFLGPGCKLDKFEPKRVIGTGLMGTVQLAKWKKDGTWCALKMVKKDYVCRHNDGRHVQAERKLLNMCDNPFICSLFGTFQDKKFIYFVLEFAAGGELFSRLHNKKGIFGAQTSKFYLAEILVALEHVHSQGYCYRDLKPENVMLDEEGHCKLIDFGFAAKPDKEGLLHTNVGTPAYLSPEQLNHKKTGGYRIFVDFWSFACLMFEFMTGKTPFCKSHKETSYAIYLRVLKGKISFPGHFEKDAKDLVKQLTKADMSIRVKDIQSIKDHKWFEDIKWDKVLKREMVPPHVPNLKIEGDCHYFDQYGEVDDSEREPNKIDSSVFHGF